MANYGMALDYKNCINCKACEVACKEENGVLLGADKHRIWVGANDVKGEWPLLDIASAAFLPSQCQHCEEAPCQEVCPTNATYYNYTKTVGRYLDLLEKMFVIRKVTGFSRNLRNEMKKKAKYYFLDLGVRNA
ncbi:MAG TPA: 4Fe-4S dicluster domain-containing protein, partial [Epsilonproteobacteria bacterium]|nr:4Fe-4S dicluster domain-containing protein [Campylobacterota bacterium]